MVRLTLSFFHCSSASHLPYNRNGLKFFTSEGGLGKNDIAEILARADKIYHVMSKESTKSAASVADRVAHTVDYMQQYTSDLVNAVRKGAGGVGKPTYPALLVHIALGYMQYDLGRLLPSTVLLAGAVSASVSVFCSI